MVLSEYEPGTALPGVIGRTTDAPGTTPFRFTGTLHEVVAGVSRAMARQ
jgi:hypothetical protein